MKFAVGVLPWLLVSLDELVSWWLIRPLMNFQKQQPQTPDIPQTVIKEKTKKEKIIIIFRFSKNSPQILY
jgi:hypothetical protein